MIEQTPLVNLSITISFVMISLSFVLATFRLIKGPSVPDQVAAADLITNITLAVIGLFVVYTRQYVFIDVISVIALVAFLATVGFAMHLEKERTK